METLARVIVFSVAGLLLASGCTSEANPAAAPGADEMGASPSSGSVGDAPRTCTRVDEGCECEAGSASVDCMNPPIYEGSNVVCEHGLRYCREGVWSSCESLERVVRPRASSELSDGPVRRDDCNPNQYTANDVPNHADLNPGNHDDVMYDPTQGGLVLVPDGTVMTMLDDSDGDGTPDIIDDFPMDPTRDGNEDGFGLQLPFGGPSDGGGIPVETTLRTADVYFLMDTTGSMGAELANLRRDLASGTFGSCPEAVGTGITGAIRCEIADTNFGVGRFDDYPTKSYGSPGCNDVAFENFLNVTNNIAATQAAVNSLDLHCGNDYPESATQALWAVATGNGLGPYLPASTGCSQPGHWGYPCFRPDTIPIIIMLTDATMHNGPNPTNDYVLGPPVTLPTTWVNVTGNNTQASAYNMGNITGAWQGFKGTTCGRGDNYNTPPRTAAVCYADGEEAVFRFTVTTAGTYTFTTEGTELGGSTLDSAIFIYDAAMNPLTCQREGGSTGYLDAKVTTFLAPGTYHLSIDGASWWSSGCGAYQITVGQPPPPPGGPVTYPVTWVETLTALNARGIKVITVNSGAGAIGESETLGLATGSTDSAGDPYNFPINGNGTGLSSTIADAVKDLADYNRLDVSMVAQDNPATPGVDERDFVATITALSYPAGRCTGYASVNFPQDKFTQCLPGTSVNFDATFQNNIVMPTMVPQVFTFDMDVLGDDRYVLKTIPVRIVIPPVILQYEAEGHFQREYDAHDVCDIPPERVTWGDLEWNSTTPSDSKIEFEIRTSQSSTFAAVPDVVVRDPGDSSPINISDELLAAGVEPNLPFLQVKARLYASSALTETPVLTSFNIAFTCDVAE